MTREIDGERVHIIDGLLDPVIIGMFERLVVDLPYFRSNYDKSKDEPGRHLRHDFGKSMIETFPLLGGFRDDVLARVRQIDAGRGETIEQFFALDQYFGAVQYPHHDTPGGMTALYFANADWEPDWQGELVFYDKSGEASMLVAPKPGRLCLFNGEIVHRGGVPSPLCRTQRFTVVIKTVPAGHAAVTPA
ncbi:2OG-Fe(II) oxygenase [Novosphingobium sp.]|uniref:2OG-Fe(II) oxygenase n=1 Tax=Novosphingobium sp. TaxID=1874826 RepID=UPI0025D51F30|nr:2OG-Fe(II) oxygenase [Novosphingobium sp.]